MAQDRATQIAAPPLLSGRKVVAATGTPEALIATTTLVQSVTLVAQKAQGSANTGIVYVGITAVNGEQDYPLAAGEKLVITAPAGSKLDLSQIYLDVATAADGVNWLAVQ